MYKAIVFDQQVLLAGTGDQRAVFTLPAGWNAAVETIGRATHSRLTSLSFRSLEPHWTPVSLQLLCMPLDAAKRRVYS